MIILGIGRGIERRVTHLVTAIKRALGLIMTEDNYSITTEDLRSFKKED